MILVIKTKFMWCKDMAMALTSVKAVGVVLALMAAGCATNRESYADKEAQRVIAVRDQMRTVIGECANKYASTPEYAVYWEKTVMGPSDDRKMALLTLNKPLSKAYIQAARFVGESYNNCDDLALPYAKSISTEYGKAYVRAANGVTAVYVNILNGQYKTYGELNQQMLKAMQNRADIMQAANDKLADDYLAASERERVAEQQRRAAAMMMFGAMTQGYASGYQQGQQNYQNAYQAPKTTNCRYIGSYLNCQSY